jgi:hypothetical protein
VTVLRARDRAQDARTGLLPERTCFRCDGEFRVPSEDRRVYCPACRNAYGFPAPTLTDFTPGAELALFPARGREVPGA